MQRRILGVALLVCAAALGAVLFWHFGNRVVVVTGTPRAQAETAPTPDAASTPEPPTAPEQQTPPTSPSDPAPADATTSTDDTAPTTPSKPVGCHLYDVLESNTSETRKEFASVLTEKMDGLSTDIYVTAGGDDNDILLITAPPENEPTLDGFASMMPTNEKDLANICMHGFVEVQFIIRDENLNQRLVSRVRTDPERTWKYANQIGGATPVQ